MRKEKKHNLLILRLESVHKLSKVLSSDVESGDEEDNLSLAKLKAIKPIERNIMSKVL